MADFCKECTKEMFGEEVKNDFNGLITQKEVDAGFVMRVLCESCGLVEVGPDGAVLRVVSSPAELSGQLE